MNPIQLTIVLEGIDVRDSSQEELASEIFKKELSKKDYMPTDNFVSLRDKKMSNIRAKRISTQEDVEIYAYTTVKEEDGKIKTIVSMKIV